MAVDDSKIGYYSGWDIDQLVDTDTVSVSSGDSLVLTISGDPTIPVAHAQFQPSGSTKWFDEGTNSTNNTQAGLFTFYTYISGSSFRAVTSSAGTIRYYKWQDKVDY